MIKKSKKTRCPWCGEIQWDNDLHFVGKYNLKRRCSNCNRYSAPVKEAVGIFDRYFILLLCYEYLYTRNVLLTVIIFIIYYLWLYYFVKNVPYKRVDRNIEPVIPKEDLQEKRLLDAKIKWNCSKRRIFKLWNNKLLIIISVDEAGTAVSQPLCVRIKKSKECYVLTKINESKEFDVDKCKRFYVYWGEEKVGEGRAITENIV